MAQPITGAPRAPPGLGVETTTGPPGQGLADSVGMAAAGHRLGTHCNRPGFESLIDFDVYDLCDDGCITEGVTYGAASLAGHYDGLPRDGILLRVSEQARDVFRGDAIRCVDDGGVEVVGGGGKMVRAASAASSPTRCACC